MSVRRATVVIVVVLALVAGCAPGSGPSQTPSAGGSGWRPDPASLTFTGTPGDTSPTWAADLDPDSQFGLHRRKGLPTVVKPGVMVLSAAAAASIRRVTITNRDECLAEVDTHPMCRFELQFDALPEGVVVGSVLNSGITKTTPNGLLVKVTGIDGATVTGVQASLGDALESGEFWAERQLDPSKLRAKPRLAPGVTIKPRVGGLRRSLPGRTLPDFDASLPGALTLNVEPVDGVKLNGSLDFGAGCGLDGGVNSGDLAWVEVSCHAWEEATLKVTSSQNGVRHSDRYFVADFPLAAFPIPIGPIIVVVVVDILITADLNGTVHAGLSYAATERAEVYGGLRFSLTGGLDHDGGVKVSSWSTGAAVKADASVTALGRAEVRLSAYGVLGFAAGADASVGLVGGPTQSPRWKLTGNAGIFAKIFLGILGWEVSAQIAYHLKSPYAVAQHSNAKPVITVSWPTEGAVVLRGGLLPPKAQASAVDDEDGVLPITWVDEADNVTLTGTGPQTLPFKALGVHRIWIRATDSGGRTAEKLVQVTVQNPSLTLAITWRGLDGTALGGTPSLPSGSTLFADVTVQSSALSGPSCSVLTWQATGATLATDGSCRARVTLGPPGKAVVSADLSDSYGTQATASRNVIVVAAPVVVVPQFAGIDVTSAGRHLVSGDSLLGKDPIVLTVTYLNRAQAKVTPQYEWSYLVGTKTTGLPGPAGESDVSTRSFSPPSPWGLGATFKVTVRDAGTKQVLTSRSFLVTWQSLPK